MTGATVLLLAGEASGDEYGAAVARALRARLPEVRLVGTGGSGMRSAGVELLAGLDDLAVMGFAEVLPRIPFFAGLERGVRRQLQRPELRLVVLIDYPGFNLRVARAAHRADRPVLYYVAPKVWAWNRGRVRTLAEHVDRVAVVLPFEQQFLAEAGVSATFVGHPLLDRTDDVADRKTFCARWGLDPGKPLLAVLPGSRPQELRRHLAPFVSAAERVRTASPDLVPVVSRAPSLSSEPFRELSPVVVGDTRALLRHARLALVKSGTATLEAAIEGTPAVVGYRTSGATWAVARRVVRLDHISLPNLIAGQEVVTERVQDAMTPASLARALERLVADGPERSRQIEGLGRVRASLGTPGAAERVAQIALELMEPGA